MNDNSTELIKLSSNIYNISSVLLEYCKNKNNCEELAKIIPILRLLFREADNLNFKLSCFEE